MPVVKINDILIDAPTQSRVEVSENILCEYAEAMKAGDEFPAPHLVFDGSSYYVADGHHRIMAAKLAGLTDIEAFVVDGGLRDAILLAVGSNASHGVRRTVADRRKAVMLLLADVEWSEWSDREIAKACRVSRELVAKLREESGRHTEAVKCNRGGQLLTTRPARRRKGVYLVETSQMANEDFDNGEVELELLRDAVKSASSEMEAMSDRLTAALAGGDEHAREEASRRISDLRQALRQSEIERKAIAQSRDAFQQENAELMNQLKKQRKSIDYLKRRCTCGACGD